MSPAGIPLGKNSEIIAPTPQLLTRHLTMIQRSLLRQSRALSSNLPRNLATLPSRYSSSPLRILPIPASRSFLPKWYSTTPETKAEASEASAAESSEVMSGKDEVEAPEDPLKKELETKNREIIDLKVSLNSLPPYPRPVPLHPPQPLPTFSSSPGQIPPLRRRLPQPPRPHETRRHRRPRLRHHPLRQRPHR